MNQAAVRDRSALAGGVASGWNALSEIGPVVMRDAEGPYVYTEDDRRLTDFIMGWGSCFLGHNPPAMKEALQRVLRGGFLPQYETNLHAELAEIICDSVPCAEQVRFANSGLEATMYAVRLARAATGRNLVVKFEGHFHGLSDELLWNVDASPRPGDVLNDGTLERMVGSPGVPPDVGKRVIPVTWNDSEMVERVFASVGSEIAAIILEPIALNIGCLAPAEGFLTLLRRLTEKHGALLIFDEVLTGFRVALGGAQELYGVVPDIATYGKALGCGMPISAVASSSSLLRLLSPPGSVAMSGTNTGRILSVAGTLAAMSQLREPGFFDLIGQLNEYLVQGIREVLAAHGVPAHVEGYGGRVGVHLGSSRRPTNMSEVRELYDRPYAARLFRALSEKYDLYGFLLPLGYCPEPVTISAVHEQSIIDSALSRFDAALGEMPYESV